MPNNIIFAVQILFCSGYSPHPLNSKKSASTANHWSSSQYISCAGCRWTSTCFELVYQNDRPRIATHIFLTTCFRLVMGPMHFFPFRYNSWQHQPTVGCVTFQRLLHTRALLKLHHALSIRSKYEHVYIKYSWCDLTLHEQWIYFAKWNHFG